MSSALTSKQSGCLIRAGYSRLLDVAVIRAIRLAVDIDSLLRGLGRVEPRSWQSAQKRQFGRPVSVSCECAAGNKSKLV